MEIFFQFGLPFTRIQWKRSPKTLLFKKTGHFRKLRCPVQTTRVDYVTGSDTSNAHASKMVPFLVTIVFSCRRAKTIQVECLIQNINLFLKYSDSACGWKVYDKSHAKTSRKGQRRNGETSDWTECVSQSSGIQVSVSQYFPPYVILKLSGKIFACPAAEWRGKIFFTNYNAFSFLRRVI